ncbi:MAG: nucleotidyl transferase AbiEii/AbiGii toxin family protein [Weeksellaceae bacterium]|jgi:hypothetical protein
MSRLHYETVTPQLKDVLFDLMSNPLFNAFRLVGGTSLSLRYGHRLSVDIDLFTDAPYGSIDFAPLEKYLQQTYPYYYKTDKTEIVGFGRSYYVGQSEMKSVKVDLFYTDPFIREAKIIDNIRIAHVDDVVAMKIDVVSRGGRKKDFWDLHYLLDHYSIPQMVDLHKQRNEWTHDPDEIYSNFVNFEIADEMPDPACFLHKDWNFIKMDFADAILSK